MSAFHFLIRSLFFCGLVIPITGDCLSAFSSPRNQRFFDVCLKEDCILFRTEQPFVFLDSKSTDVEHQRPFPCSQYSKQHKGKLDGILFSIINLVKPLENARCVWVGPNCTFDGMLDFIRNSAAAGKSHRFIAGSILFELPYRISVHTIPSSTIFEDQVRIIGPPIEGYNTFREAAVTLRKPFTRKGWYYILGCVIGHLVLRIAMVFIFSLLHEREKVFAWGRFFDIDNSYKRTDDTEEKSWRRVNKAWLIIATIFTVTSMLFWEVAVAVIVYETRLDAPLEHIDPTRFAIIRNTTQEAIFKGLVKSPLVRWNQYRTSEDVYKALLDKSNNISYTIGYEVFNRYKMNTRQEICENLRLYEGVPSQLVSTRKPPTLSGVWFYSSMVPEERRIEIDKSIASNKQKGRFIKIIDDKAGEAILDACKLKNNQIDWVLLWLLHVIITGIPFVILFSFIFIHFIRLCKKLYMRRWNVGEDEEQGFPGAYYSREPKNDSGSSGYDDLDSGIDLSDIPKKEASYLRRRT